MQYMRILIWARITGHRNQTHSGKINHLGFWAAPCNCSGAENKYAETLRASSMSLFENKHNNVLKQPMWIKPFQHPNTIIFTHSMSWVRPSYMEATESNIIESVLIPLTYRKLSLYATTALTRRRYSLFVARAVHHIFDQDTRIMARSSSYRCNCKSSKIYKLAAHINCLIVHRNATCTRQQRSWCNCTMDREHQSTSTWALRVNICLINHGCFDLTHLNRTNAITSVQCKDACGNTIVSALDVIDLKAPNY